MKYKLGQGIFIKAEISDIDNISKEYFVIPNPHNINWVSEDKIIPMDKTYSDGLTDAWELARKIVMGATEGGFESRKVIDIFGKTAYYTLKELTYEEALAKIEAYEKEKEIKVGDVVEGLSGYKAVATVIGRDRIQVMFDDGTHTEWNPKEIKKTDKHIDIEGLLKQIGE